MLSVKPKPEAVFNSDPLPVIGMLRIGLKKLRMAARNNKIILEILELDQKINKRYNVNAQNK